jgi:hypothetical protein
MALQSGDPGQNSALFSFLCDDGLTPENTTMPTPVNGWHGQPSAEPSSKRTFAAADGGDTLAKRNRVDAATTSSGTSSFGPQRIDVLNCTVPGFLPTGASWLPPMHAANLLPTAQPAQQFPAHPFANDPVISAEPLFDMHTASGLPPVNAAELLPTAQPVEQIPDPPFANAAANGADGFVSEEALLSLPLSELYGNNFPDISLFDDHFAGDIVFDGVQQTAPTPASRTNRTSSSAGNRQPIRRRRVAARSSAAAEDRGYDLSLVIVFAFVAFLYSAIAKCFGSP